MFQRLGNVVSRFWPALLVAWVAAAAFLVAIAPEWDDVVQDGEFAYLPKSSPSLQAEKLFQEAFPDDLLRSSVVLVVQREMGLDEQDETLIETVLTPRLERIQPLTDIAALRSDDEAEQRAAYERMSAALDALPATDGATPGLPAIPEAVKLAAVRDWHADLFGAEEDPDPETDASASLGTRIARQLAEAGIADVPDPAAIDARLEPAVFAVAPPEDAAAALPDPVIKRVRDTGDRAMGNLLRSRDGAASLVIVGLTTEFMENRNKVVLEKIRGTVDSTLDTMRKLAPRKPVPEIVLSGSATVGRDMRRAAQQSADNTHAATLILVVILLLVIYRAPVMALIPLLTVAMAVEIALSSLALLARAGVVSLFSGIEVYVTVVLYGAGVDYCLFLIARYKEELDQGNTIEEAIRGSLGKVGAALTASAGTVMCGIGMMVFAQFGKFQEAGVAMASSLFVVLLAALTFTPPLLRLAGRWAFWPRMRRERVAAPGWISPTSLMSRVLETGWFRDAWEKVGRVLIARPGTVWLASIGLMLPFAVIGVVWYNYLSYGLLTELPAESPSVIGALAVQDHFPAGTAGPLTVVLEHPHVDFNSAEGQAAIGELTDRLEARREELRIADVRSVAAPLGLNGGDLGFAQRAVVRRKAPQYYVSSVAGHAGHVTRVDVVFEDDPFSRDSIGQLETFQETMRSVLPEPLSGAETTLSYIGSTPSLRDLKHVTDSDQIRIDVLVLAGVFAILVILLRRPAISAYLIVSVFFSYLVTLGVTFVAFWLIDPQFAGLDWKVPMFLFTILIAVGEDYNIFLMTRIEEEQELHGPIHGVTVALARTGKIISSCGFIMAGTFSSLLFGTLTGMHQLGFALAFGVLLDTFVVRPILVPAYLILLYSGRFGGLGRFLGAREYVPAKLSVQLKVTRDR
ncbi:MAG: MMPL family transporter [Planctomycetales bacterium]